MPVIVRAIALASFALRSLTTIIKCRRTRTGARGRQSHIGRANALPTQCAGTPRRTERVRLDSTTATIACVRVDDKQRWCFEHLPPLGARAEMLRVRNEPADGP